MVHLWNPDILYKTEVEFLSHGGWSAQVGFSLSDGRRGEQFSASDKQGCPLRELADGIHQHVRIMDVQREHTDALAKHLQPALNLFWWHSGSEQLIDTTPKIRFEP